MKIRMNFALPSTALIVAFAATAMVVVEAQNDLDAFYDMRDKIEKDVLELRSAAEAAYLTRCDASKEIRTSCEGSNYHVCGSSFPEAVCLQAKNEDMFYGRGDTCVDPSTSSSSSAPSNFTASTNETLVQTGECYGSTWDFSVSAVRVPPNEEDYLLDSVCTGQTLDEYFVQKRETDREYWLEQGMQDVPWMYFGATDGVMRTYPARPDDNCGEDDYEYDDPRERPWYAVSDPNVPRPNKNVILLLDNSGSMEGAALDNMKQLATDIVDNLIDGDRLAIMPFNDQRAETPTSDSQGPQGYNTVLNVNKETKKVFIPVLLDNIESVGATNMYNAFTDVFKLLDEAHVNNELVSAPCKAETEVMFLTDLRTTYPSRDVNELLDYFQRRFDQMKKASSVKSVNLFWVDISEAEGNAIIAKRSGYVVPGMTVYEVNDEGWTQVTTTNPQVALLSKPVELIRTFTNAEPDLAFLYENQTAWVGPYEFSTNGVMGVSVSTPVFDRSVTPARFVGVVGMDLPVTVLERTIANEEKLSQQEWIDGFWDFTTVLCPAEVTIQEQLDMLGTYDSLDEKNIINVGLQFGRSGSRTTLCGDTLPASVFANTNFTTNNSTTEEVGPQGICCTRTGTNTENGTCIDVEVTMAPVFEEVETKEEQPSGVNRGLLLGILIPVGFVAVGGMVFLLGSAATTPPPGGSTSGGGGGDEEAQ